jgi:hypothetical protein
LFPDSFERAHIQNSANASTSHSPILPCPSAFVRLPTPYSLFATLFSSPQAARLQESRRPDALLPYSLLLSDESI